jgi:hypothetical protein
MAPLRVEDVFPLAKKAADGSAETMAVMQVGADLLLRACYAPVHFQHRMQLLDAHKQPLSIATPPTPASSACNSARTGSNEGKEGNKFGWGVPDGQGAVREQVGVICHVYTHTAYNNRHTYTPYTN